MILRLPANVQPGLLADTQHTLRRELFEKYKAILAPRFLMPFDKCIHYSELEAAAKGKRTLPIYNKETETYVKYLLAVARDPTNKVACQPIAKYRCSASMRARLDYLLVCRGQAPLMQPNIHVEYTMFYITYCCAILDPHNITQWNELYSPTIPDGLGDTFLEEILKEKYRRLNLLSTFGLDTTIEYIYNAMLKVNHSLLDKVKYTYLAKTYPKSAKKYMVLKDRCVEKFIIRRKHLIADSLRHYSDLNGVLSQRRHKVEFDRLAEIAINFDPFLKNHSGEYFKENEIESLYEKYRAYVKRVEMLENFYVEIRAIMTKDPNIGLDDPLNAMLTSGFTRIEVEQIPIQRRADQHNSRSNSRGSVTRVLCRQLARMNMRPDSPITSLNKSKQKRKGLSTEKMLPGISEESYNTQHLDKDDSHSGKRDPKELH